MFVYVCVCVCTREREYVLPKTVCERSVLFHIHREIKKVFVFASNCFTTQALCFVSESTLKYLMDPSRTRWLTKLLLLRCGIHNQGVMRRGTGKVK